jgi:DNA-binding GntR family transcriptional regulator
MDGADIRVTAEDISRLRSLLRLRPRDLLFFELAVQTGLYAKDLLRLKVSDLVGTRTGRRLMIGPGSGAGRSRMTSSIRRAFLSHVRRHGLSGRDYLFPSRKGGEPLTLVSLSRLISGWFREAGLPDLHGVLALRRISAAHVTGRREPQPAGPLPAALPHRVVPYVSLRDSIFQELQREIVCGRILPGHRIYIESMAHRIGVSTIPVREALAMLAACGFLRTDKKRGYLAAELSVENLREILELRLLLECKAAEKAAVNRTEAGLQRIVDCHTSFVEARMRRDVDGIFRANRNFHDAINNQAEMPILKSHIDQAWYRVSPYYHIIFRQVEKPLPSSGIHNHEKIIEAIRSRDPRETCRWVREDLRDNARFVIEVIRNQRTAAGRESTRKD